MNRADASPTVKPRCAAISPASSRRGADAELEGLGALARELGAIGPRR